MAEDKIKRLAREVYEEVGGQDNVEKLRHCMTRVRMDIRDYDKVNLEGLKRIDGVMGVVEDDTLQVVIGPGTVNKVAQEMVDMAGVKLGEPFPHSETKQTGKQLVEEKAAQVKAAQKEKNKNNSGFKVILKSISNIFVPLIPAFVGAGIIGGIAAVMSNLLVAGTIGDSWQQYIDVLNIIKNGIFAYLALYTGINSASEFGATPALGGVIGAVTMLTGMNPEAPLPNILTGGTLSAGQGGIIGVIFAVWLLSLIEKQLHKIIPDSIDIIITPTLSLLVIGLITIFLIMPVAGFISNSLVGVINVVLEKGGMLAGLRKRV